MEESEIKVGNKKYTVRVALTEDEKTTGLSEETSELKDDEGMIFVYDEPEDLWFTMEETNIDLDIVAINKEGIVTKVHHATALDDLLYECPDSLFVLEVKLNSGIKEGDLLSGEDFVDDDFTEEDKDTVKKYGKMLILDENGDVQYRLEGGERIVSRIKTRLLLKAAIKAYRSDLDSDYIKVGKIILSELIALDNREPQYVNTPSKNKEN